MWTVKMKIAAAVTFLLFSESSPLLAVDTGSPFSNSMSFEIIKNIGHRLSEQDLDNLMRADRRACEILSQEQRDIRNYVQQAYKACDLKRLKKKLDAIDRTICRKSLHAEPIRAYIRKIYSIPDSGRADFLEAILRAIYTLPSPEDRSLLYFKALNELKYSRKELKGELLHREIQSINCLKGSIPYNSDLVEFIGRIKHFEPGLDRAYASFIGIYALGRITFLNDEDWQDPVIKEFQMRVYRPLSG